MPKTRSICPCDSGKAYADCCGPLHLGTLAPTAESLMRSRYSAYVLGLEEYLLDTWHPDTRPMSLELNKGELIRWLGLSIKRHANTTDTTSTVEFVARYRTGGGKAERLHEVSEFELLDRWYYVSGTIE